jgi:hypothetical protein
MVQETLSRKNPSSQKKKKRGGGVAQGEDPEFKPQHPKPKKKKFTEKLFYKCKFNTSTQRKENVHTPKNYLCYLW